ncbi:hypothetical protein L3V86_02205 [Thiotrichales bacterium 19S11-10]|nr:hypothetical protein [Thiotrichales bacterium 19S11-10]
MSGGTDNLSMTTDKMTEDNLYEDSPEIEKALNDFSEGVKKAATFLCFPEYFFQKYDCKEEKNAPAVGITNLLPGN